MFHGLLPWSIVSIIVSLLASEEDFNFRPPSFLSALPSRSPLSSGTIRHRRRSSRSPGGISLISYDNNNGDERSGRGAGGGGGGGGAERTRRRTTITGIKYRVGLVRNSHIDRALRMEAGERFESSWSSKPVPSSATSSSCLPRSLVIPFTFAAGPLRYLISSLHASGPQRRWRGGPPGRLATRLSS